MKEETKVAAVGVASQNPMTNQPSKAPIAEKRDARGPRKTHNNQYFFSDPSQVKFVNCLMKKGKKSVAERVLCDTLNELSRLGEKDPLKTFEMALQNATPTMEVSPKRIGGAVYQIPSEVKPRRQQSLSVRWILDGARSRKGQQMFRRLAQELLDASRDTGYAVNKKKEVHKMAQANKAFAHLARY